MTAKLTLRRADGRVYLKRRGVEWNRLGGIFVHHMTAPDPGVDLHNHPWWFASIIVKGGYCELRGHLNDWRVRGHVRRPGSIRAMQLDDFHHITELLSPKGCWTIVIHGPRRQRWGFDTPKGYVDWEEYHGSARGLQRGLKAEQ